MGRPVGMPSVGPTAELAGTTVRTLQYYDRVALLVAHRSADGRRGYDQALLERLHRVRLLSELRLRCRRAVAAGLADVLRRHPDAEVPATAMRALMSFEDTLLAMIEAGMHAYRMAQPGPTRVPADRLEQLRVPTLVLAAGESPTHDPDELAEGAQRLPGGRVLTYPGTSHALDGEEPDRLAADIGSFVDAHE